MNPEHKLLKFVIVPLILILFGTFAYWHFNSDTQWNEAGRYYLDNYQGDRTFSVTNVQDYLNKSWGSDNLKYVVSMWHGGKSYHFSKQSGSDKEEVDSESFFRVASVSKVFTSIAMLQLVEKGKIKLDDPVEKYVPYKKNFKQQPTVGDLLLHTAGFDNNNTSFFYHRRIDKPTLKDFLFRQELVQAIEPRKVVDYTNTAFDIAGYIIEQVSGQRFEDYCQENIFLPLGMKRTSFDEPESYVSGMDSKGQVVENYYVGGRPSGGLVSTSKDMSLFMECLMQGGRIGKTQIFSPKLMSAIFEKQFEMDPNLPLKKSPVFWINDFNDMKCYAQMGKILGFSSHLIIIPGKVAIFCATADQDTGQQIGWLLLNTFFGNKVDSDDLSVVFSKTNPESSQKMQDSLDVYTGRWINMFAWNRNYVEKIANAVAFNLNLTDEDGKLFIDGVEMEKVDDLTFRSDDWYVKFVCGEDGEIKYLQTGQDAHIKAPCYMDSKLIIPYITITLGIFVLAMFQFVFGALMRRWGKEKSTKHEKLFRWSAFSISVLNIGFVSVFAIILLNTDVYNLGFKPDLYWYAVFSMPILALLATPILIYALIKAWKLQTFSVSSRVNAVLFVTAQCGFVIFLAFWNLLGIRF